MADPEAAGQTPNTDSARKRYDALEPFRAPYIARARDSARLTLPYIMPPEEWNGSTPLPQPYQMIGARGVNNLGNKMMLAAFPPNSPFFRIKADLEDVGAPDEEKANVEKALGKYERKASDLIEKSGDRAALGQSILHQLVVGNCLLYIGKMGEQSRLYSMDKYVVRRSPSGETQEIVVKERSSLDTFKPIIQEAIKGIMSRAGSSGVTEQGAGSSVPGATPKAVDLYTYVKLDGDMIRSWQEVLDLEIPGTRSSYPKDKSPWIAQRLRKIDGQHWSPGFVEDYIGALNTLDGLERAISEGAAAAAMVKFFRNPNSTVTIKDFTDGPNGDIIDGMPDDVKAFQLDKYADFRIANERIKDLTEQFSRIFLLNSSVQRSGERVTAEEIRYVALELEDALGGAYTLLSMELQMPYANRKIAVFTRAGKLPALPKDITRPVIITGLEALGRGHDYQKLKTFAKDLREDLGPEKTAEVINASDYATRLATSLGVDAEGLVKSPDELAEAAQLQAQNTMVEAAAPQVLKTAGNMAETQMEGQVQSGQ